MRTRAGVTRLDRPWQRPGKARYALGRLLDVARGACEASHELAGRWAVLQQG
jgi:hypothetical protein